MARARPSATCGETASGAGGAGCWAPRATGTEAIVAARATARAGPARISGPDQRLMRRLQILGPDGVGGMVGEGGHRAGRIVAGVLREGRGAQDEQVRHIPALQVSVAEAVARA